MMIINLSNPLYNTIIVFISIMTLLYIIKPDTLYDSEKKQFRQFGTDSDKTLLPIYVVGILLAIILYILFNQLAKLTIETKSDQSENKLNVGTDPNKVKYSDNTNNTNNNTQTEIATLKNQIMIMNNTLNQMNQLNLTQLNQLNQLNQINQLSQLNQLGQLSQFNQLNQLSQLNQFNQPSHLDQTDRFNTISGVKKNSLQNNSYYPIMSHQKINKSNNFLESAERMNSNSIENIINTVLTEKPVDDKISLPNNFSI